MGIIKKLPPEEIQKIAAGEVIERPANVVKELLENALDASATAITLFVERGGKDLIRIIDNGKGMDEHDARLSIMHHATSKISSIDDLETLKTFGFRGEALSSIASVSKLTLVTKEERSLHAYKISVIDQVITSSCESAGITGTDITVSDLFYNVPARRKFLKSDQTEWNAINQLMQAYALCWHECAFKIYHNNKLIFACQSHQTFQQRLSSLYENNRVRSNLSCQASQSDARIHGVMTDTHYWGYDRSSIFFYVNRRWVKNSKLISALLKGYKAVLPPGKFPAAVIFLEVDPSLVDINTHPRKEEVVFLHPRRLENLIEDMVTDTLAGRTSFTLQAAANKSNTSQLFSNVSQASRSFKPESFLDNSRNYQHNFAQVPLPVSKSQDITDALDSMFSKDSGSDQQAQISSIIQDDSIQSINQVLERNYTLIGQLNATYILTQTQEGLLIIDQHAAHERILYEQFSCRFSDIAVVPLLFPTLIFLTEAEGIVLELMHDVFKAYGIVIERASVDHYAVKAIPVILKNHNIADIVKHMLSKCPDGPDELDEINKDQSFFNILHHELRAQMACKGAVKAGDTLTTEHMHELISSLLTVENRFSCPHGRPTSWLITISEIERKFKRI